MAVPLAELARRAGAAILLDVNNDVRERSTTTASITRSYLRALPPERIGQIHLAGHSVEGELLIDTHDNFVREEVWQLYRDAVALYGARATMIEWDAQVPAFPLRNARAGARANGQAADRKGKASAMPPEAGASPDVEPLRAIYDALLAQITSGHGAPSLPDATALVTGDARASGAERIHVYQHMYRARLIEALEGQFPRVSRWLDADAFAEVVAAYVTDEPSRHPSLRFIGRRFPDWLAARAPAEARHPALADLARLEWAREDVFDAADQGTLTLETVRGWPPDRFGGSRCAW